MVKTYNIAALQLSLAGLTLDGFGDSDAISIEFMSEEMSSYASADGDVAVAANNDPRLNVKITLHQMSKANAVLSEVWQTQAAAIKLGVGVPITPFFMLDPASGDTYREQSAVIMKLPDAAYGKEIDTREWTILLPFGKRNMILGARL